MNTALHTKFVVEYSHGLNDAVFKEFKTTLNGQLPEHSLDTESLFPAQTAYASLIKVRSCSAIYHFLHFDISRPKALLGHQHFNSICSVVLALKQKLPGARGLRLEAAGKTSSIMTRLKTELQKACNLNAEDEETAIMMRIRPSHYYRSGWEVLVRTSLLPLSVRSWREDNVKGALNGSLAAAIVQLIPSKPQGAILDPMCGTGTLLIEYQKRFPHAPCLGIDLSADMMRSCSKHRILAACPEPILIQSNALKLPFRDRSVFGVLSNPPWGERIALKESHEFHRQYLQELARVLHPGSFCFCLSQRSELILNHLKDEAFRLEASYSVKQRGFTPTLFHLQKR